MMIPPTTMMSDWTLVAFGIVLFATALLVLFLVYKASKGRAMSASAKKQVMAAWNKAVRIENPTLRILEADKVLDMALSFLGYTGTLGEKLKVAGPRFSDKNGVWSAHKLRNTLAHEHDVQLTEKDARTAMKSFERAVGELCRR